MIKKLLVQTADSQFARYAVAGGVATAADFLVLFLLTDWFGMYYLLSATIAFSIGITVNYIISVTWVFSQRKLSNLYLEILIFLITGVVGLALNNFILWALTEKFLLYYLYSKAVATVIVLFWNYYSKKVILF